MRHRKAGRKLGRTTAHREALLRNQVTSLLLYEKIVTTEAKAKELRKLAEKMITLAKREDLHARRQAAEVIKDEKVLKKLFDTIRGRYQGRDGGYTRITKLDYRMGDGAPLAAIELVELEEAAKPAKGSKRKRRERVAEVKARPPAEAQPARRRRRRRRGGARPAAPAEAPSPPEAPPEAAEAVPESSA